jgi:nucleotide-binding universal stress UspA family protein
MAESYSSEARTYNEIRDAVIYARRREGDADSIVSSLYANRSSGAKKGEESSEEPPDDGLGRRAQIKQAFRGRSPSAQLECGAWNCNGTLSAFLRQCARGDDWLTVSPTPSKAANGRVKGDTMHEMQDRSSPIFESVLHPTDFSEGSRVAFHHALKASLLAKARLTLMRVSSATESEWAEFPGVRETLERWGLLQPGSPRSAVPKLGIDVHKVVAQHGDPVRAVVHYLDEHAVDLIVLAAHRREGQLRWLQPSRAEPIARGAGEMTLFIPGDCPGFVSAQDGSVSLQNILIPVAATPRPELAIEAAARLVRRLGCPSGTFTILHVGEKGAMPSLQCPELAGWAWRKVTQSGDVIQGIVDAAAKNSADLIVMTTDGRNGFLDALRGSHSERVLREVSVPLLTVPEGSVAGAQLASNGSIRSPAERDSNRSPAKAPRSKAQWIALGVAVFALLAVPTPLLPPHRLAEALQSALGLGWQGAYLISAVVFHIGFYGAVGVLAALTVNRAETTRRRLLQIVTVPLLILALAVVIRTVKLGHLPAAANAAIALAACSFGVALGLGVVYRGWRVALPAAAGVIALALWAVLGGSSAELSRATEARLAELVARAPTLPFGDERFGALVQSAFAASPGDPAPKDAVAHNRAALLALGIAIGHERLARLAGLDPKSELVRRAGSLRDGTTVRGRGDWAQHYALSAALAVLENPLFSEGTGLLKEEVDALSHGSGFSFADLAADRAGVRLARAATRSEADATAVRAHLSAGFAIDDFFPQTAGLPENLTTEGFRATYGGMGSERYRELVAEIEARLNRCAALAAHSR